MALPTSYSASLSLPVHGGASPLQSTIAEAQLLRLRHPEKYGVKGSRAGDEGYVKNGWRAALRDAAAARRASKPGATQLSAEQQAIHADYLAELHLLQAKYFPRLGRELSNKAKAASTRVPSQSTPAAVIRPTVAVASLEDDHGSEPQPFVRVPIDPPSDQTTEVATTALNGKKKNKRTHTPALEVTTTPAVSST